MWGKRFHLNAKKIVITGGPSTGKTSLIDEMQNAGYFCYPEVIRQMTLDAKKKGALTNYETNPIASVINPLDFNTKILKARLKDYQESLKQNEALVFFDRGMPDVLAYMEFYAQPLPKVFTTIVKEHRYDQIFLLPMWQDIFVQDGERFESYEDALRINQCLLHTYQQLDYNVVELPKASVADRIQFILQNVRT